MFKNTHKKLLLLVVAIGLLLINQPLFAQEGKIANKLFYAELLGPGGVISANFDSRFKSNERLGLGYRLGAGAIPISHKAIGDYIDEYGNLHGWGYSNTVAYVTFPVGLNYVIGNPSSNKTFEIGGGITFFTDGGERNMGFLTFMYRTMPVNGGFSFRIGFTPIILWGNLYPYGAIGFGYAF